MADEQYWLSILSGERSGVRANLLRFGLHGAELLYAAGLTVYLGAESVGLRRRARLPVPVISVGNLTVGGTGKTPFTQWLTRRMLFEGLAPGILNRGHGGAIAPRPALVSDTSGPILLSAFEAGDEAVLLASSLPGVPVAVGKDRRESGRLLIEQAHPSVIVLDDGMQYWQLYRDIDVVLLDAHKPFDNGHALPRGLMREPASGLGRAGAVVFTRAGGLTDIRRSALLREAEHRAPAAAVFFAEHAPGKLIPFNSAAAQRQPESPLLVCGIARPDSFEAAARQAGVAPVGLLPLADHQQYGDAEKESIAGKMRSTAADSVIITAKDAVKLSAEYLDDVPVYILEISVEIENADALWSHIAAKCGLTDRTLGMSGKTL